MLFCIRLFCGLKALESGFCDIWRGRRRAAKDRSRWRQIVDALRALRDEEDLLFFLINVTKKSTLEDRGLNKPRQKSKLEGNFSNFLNYAVPKLIRQCTEIAMH